MTLDAAVHAGWAAASMAAAKFKEVEAMLSDVTLRERMVAAMDERDRVTPRPLTKEDLADACLDVLREYGLTASAIPRPGEYKRGWTPRRPAAEGDRGNA